MLFGRKSEGRYAIVPMIMSAQSNNVQPFVDDYSSSYSVRIFGLHQI